MTVSVVQSGGDSFGGAVRFGKSLHDGAVDDGYDCDVARVSHRAFVAIDRCDRPERDRKVETNQIEPATRGRCRERCYLRVGW